MGKTAVVGMSGGVDSAVAAYLLKERGYDVIGLFMRNWDETDADGVCCAEADFEDVKAVCARLRIPYYSVDFVREYKESVFSHFLSEYAAGRTPNPDVLCNREIKFGVFADYARSLGADFIATGHYCGIERRDGKNFLLKAADREKDQTYFLNQVREKQLDGVLFPLARLNKKDVRATAAREKLSVADKKDSTGVCFIGERDFRKFLGGYIRSEPGDIREIGGGRVVGRHRGMPFYTLGQRRGLNIGGKREYGEGRWFVAAKDLKENALYVSCGDETPLLSAGAICSEANFIPSPLKFENYAARAARGKTAAVLKNAPRSDAPPSFKCAAKFRHRQAERGVTVTPLPDGRLRADFDAPQRAVTPGQYAAFYIGKYCVGGALIESVTERF